MKRINEYTFAKVHWFLKNLCFDNVQFDMVDAGNSFGRNYLDSITSHGWDTAKIITDSKLLVEKSVSTYVQRSYEDMFALYSEAKENGDKEDKVKDLPRLRDCEDVSVNYKERHFEQTEDTYFPDGENWNAIEIMKTSE